ncbi:peptide deformylase [Devosia sediminis]|uniref:Peptide deformylase-like n=1 Tax=Devosia sediminis TaxID=2798801 RepID=A0A934IWX2_9HYPH|nr:peptide deformylase [Devosia sediminis]MBJ3784495.1 peptide deformylase [Devosia sediminis]
MADETISFILFPDPRLTRVAISQPVDDELRSIGAALLQAARDAQAYGLAAAHIGQVAPVAVVSLADPSTRDYRLLYNPRILLTSGSEVSGKEGSVSMPGIEVDVVRPENARIGFDDEAGNPHELELTGFAARVAQHEIDQVNGVLFLSRVSRLKRDTAIKRFGKLARKG